MKQQRTVATMLIAGTLLIGLTVLTAWAASQSCGSSSVSRQGSCDKSVSGNHDQKMASAMSEHVSEVPSAVQSNATAPSSLETIYTEEAPALSKAINEAIRLLEDGKQEAAGVELQKAQKSTRSIASLLASHLKPELTESRCPMRGSVEYREQATEHQFHHSSEQKHCGGCPGM